MISSIVDSRGRPIVDTKLQKEAEEKILDYMHKNQKQIAEWFTYWGGPGNCPKPPIQYDEINKVAYWDEQKEKKIRQEFDYLLRK
jgi:hypothetical protein